MDFGSIFSATIEEEEKPEEKIEEKAATSVDYPMLFKVDENGNIVTTGIEVDFSQFPKLKVDYALWFFFLDILYKYVW